MGDTTAFEGQEFDWFARDIGGRIAVFATGGSGPIPDSVSGASALHAAAAALIPVSGWGSPQVWDSYSAVGLYAYDWHEGAQAYRRVAATHLEPAPAISLALASVDLPSFPGAFDQSLEVRFLDLQHGA